MASTATDPDALAALLADAQEGAAQRAGAPAVRAMDFRRPRQFSGEIQRRLRRALDTFCRTASSRVSGELRTAVDLEVTVVEELTWSDAHDQLPASALTAVLAAAPINTRLLLGAEQPLLLDAIERMLGGDGTAKLVPRRFTDIDTMLAGKLLEALVEQMSVVWDELVGVTLGVSAVTSPQQSAQLAPTSEPTLAFTVEAKLGGRAHTLLLLVPFRALAPVLDQLTRVEGYDATVDTESAELMERGIGQVGVELRAEVGAVEVPMADVLALSPGDLVPLGVRAGTGVSLFVEGTALERGRPGRSGRRRAVQVLAPGESAA
ncbi:MAG: hypothetical protein AVDCRST_MAG30-2166 [uncultured Solirubrobacteraceae bacterium]|uniref:Flagellar motor switch protein FliM n=1 Tax=uncultured Solirubrobacteraceae bacterium TaxID=1162706 RepID=A0A6J4SU34_9ACTN|nr:MAG: hypothetical protein AVDCRST_MAG30-2166 [uncultured Solirubrobacteraceae bacterium]